MQPDNDNHQPIETVPESQPPLIGCVIAIALIVLCILAAQVLAIKQTFFGT